MDIITASSVEKLRRYFQSGATRPLDFRLQQLRALRNALLQHEQELNAALKTDLHKSVEETWVTETGMVLSELNHTIRQLKRWMAPERVPTNLLNLPSSSRIIREPLGVVLIIGPWNYPVQLSLIPLVGAIAAGNCVVLKPGEAAVASCAVMRKIIQQTFSPEYILFADGEGADVIPPLMQQFTFDHVFYTGGPRAGREIYRMAAERLVPVTLELGGKSPCLVAADANIEVAARRIVSTKFSNAGQMCVAPDYLLVHQQVADKLIAAIKKCILRFYGEQPETSPNYCRLINKRQYDRLISYLGQGEIIAGGRFRSEELFIEPTLLLNPPPDAPVMQEEIFGPLLPVITYEQEDQAAAVITNHPNPLAFYIFTSSRKTADRWMSAVPFGGGCVNNCSWHLTNPHLPFGGRGGSGMGRYHGRFSFDTFSHQKSVMSTPTWFDPSIKYPPMNGKIGLFKKVIR